MGSGAGSDIIVEAGPHCCLRCTYILEVIGGNLPPSVATLSMVGTSGKQAG